MATPYIGEIILFAGNFAPQGWMLCEGQLLDISEYDTLFFLIGTTYGGDGQTNFQLPDLRGRLPVHQGNLSGGSNYVLGQTGGAENVTLMVSQIPAHSHPLTGSVTILTRTDEAGNLSSPNNNYVGTAPAKKYFNPVATPSGKMAPLASTGAINPVGGSQPHSNMQPTLALNFIISVFGLYPSPS